MSEILVDWGQNNVLPLVTLTGIFFLAPKLHFILVTNLKGKHVPAVGAWIKAMTQFLPGEVTFGDGRL